MRTMKACLAVLLVAVLASNASAALLEEHFDTDPAPRGWIADGDVYYADRWQPWWLL